MLDFFRRLRFAAPASVLVAALCLASLMAAAPAAANEAAKAFERYAGDRVQILRARSLRASTRPEVRPGAERPVITYRSIADEFDTELEPTGVRAVPFVGVLHYTERIFSCEDVEASQCVEVASRPVTEIFRYRDGSWGH